MLEDRPIVQRSLIGFGAFSFVFAAAMAGTAFMISGGFGLGQPEHRASTMSDYATVTQAAWNDFAPPASAATPVYVTAATVEPAPIGENLAQRERTSYSGDETLVGDAPAPRRDQARDQASARSEEDILRDIQRDFAAYPEEPPDRSARSSYDDGVVAAKEAAADNYEY